MRGAQDAALCAFTIQMPAAEHVWDFSTVDVVMKNQPVTVSILQEKFLAASKAAKTYILAKYFQFVSCSICVVPLIS